MVRVKLLFLFFRFVLFCFVSFVHTFPWFKVVLLDAFCLCFSPEQIRLAPPRPYVCVIYAFKHKFCTGQEIFYLEFS